ncbi:MAG TPA: tRNA (guanosine(37)-N1)-methyltransferase TrmD [Candidatus Methylomirabilis sp.]|nr:tRNA (guanosine(37)-N1)-methyltransferase TrmD [Candidatus Methylomirabilis sp.]
MRIDIVTLFPAMVQAPLQESIVGRARQRGLVDIRVHNLRDFAGGRHQVTDEPPFGGGGGMILKPEPLAAAIEAARSADARVILLDPAGRRLTQHVADELARRPHLVLVCGRYEGVDERVREHLVDEELSVGDYVLSGGEAAALVVTEAVTRLLPGVLGDEGAASRDSFAQGVLEHPHYTRPEVFRGWRVPAVLLSGDHSMIARWRRLMSLWRTWQRRPDLLETADLSPEEQKWVDGFNQGRSPSDLHS